MSERVRLLVCHSCQSVQELPWCGEDPQCQHPGCVEPLEARVAEHRFADGRAHAPANLADIQRDLWDDYSSRKEILVQLARIVDPGAGDGLGSTYYDVGNNYSDDAMACWKRHNRTQDCGDYKTPKMLLRPDTREERKDLGLEVKNRPGFHLCEFCPMKSIKQTKVYSDRFRYNSPY